MRSLLKKILRSILHLTKLDRISEEAGASHVLRKAALPSMSEFLSRSLFWVTLLGFMLLGVSVLQIPELQEQISRLFQLLPQMFVAILILFVGVLAANFLSRAALLTAVNAGYRSPRLWSGLVRFVIWILAISMALEQMGLARQTVVAAFSIVFGAVMLALADRLRTGRPRSCPSDPGTLPGRQGERTRKGRGTLAPVARLRGGNWSRCLEAFQVVPAKGFAVHDVASRRNQ